MDGLISAVMISAVMIRNLLIHENWDPDEGHKTQRMDKHVKIGFHIL